MLPNAAGLNAEMFDALVVLSVGSRRPEALCAGFAKAQGLTAEMDQGRRRRLVKLGFHSEEGG